MSEYKYFPIIKTRDAELKCFQNLDKIILDQILPIYELTKSRKTTKTPDGDINRRMGQIKDIQGGNPFILDLCTDDKYINPQIEQLIDEYQGFQDWQYFLSIYKDLNIIPMVHLYEDANLTFEEVGKFVRDMSSIKSFLAVRLPYDLEAQEYKDYLLPIINNLQNNCTLYVLLDAGSIKNKNTQDVIDNYIASYNEVSMLGDKIEDIVMLCTSFPISPRDEGDDDHGEFEIIEENVFQAIRQHVNIKYGDYASINTIQVEMKGGSFVPRIDIASNNMFIYKRYRRDDGSYPKCAIKMKEDERYLPIGTWADKEIELASQGKPTGISPSFWIAVRMNYYITSRVYLRASD
ncbi:TPA: beta family protein [Vibrio cholerae]